eukprot:3188327-Karenia_brevis.AAC.1
MTGLMPPPVQAGNMSEESNMGSEPQIRGKPCIQVMAKQPVQGHCIQGPHGGLGMILPCGSSSPAN